MIVGGYRIPKGTPLIMPSIAAHLSPLNFTQPDEFLPARWLTGTDTTKTYDTRKCPVLLSQYINYMSWHIVIVVYCTVSVGKRSS